MSDITHTGSSALSTINAFHYQVLVALEKCFSSDEYNAVWIEQDGDVSVVSDSIETSEQIEVKDYSNSNLTDNHHNFWNTLKNWMDPAFKNSLYGRLILYTTQPFGKETKLNEWNQKETFEERLDILQSICNERKIRNDGISDIIRLQSEVMALENRKKLQEILCKVVLNVESSNSETIKENISKRLSQFLKKANHEAYVKGVIGHLYCLTNKKQWKIEKKDFDEASRYWIRKLSQEHFTFPVFKSFSASEAEIAKNMGNLYVKKILDIGYEDVLPNAIGDYNQYVESMSLELDNFPMYRETSLKYKNDNIEIFNAKYRQAKRKEGNVIKKSQDLYDDIISATPLPLESESPPLQYRNGAIHDAMNDDELNLKWKLEE